MWPFFRPSLAYEQAIYGSFPFWNRGYDVLGRSPLCQTKWLICMKETCQLLGERFRDAAPPGGLVSRWLEDGTWLLIHPYCSGSDDLGRPDTVAFHGVFLTPENAKLAQFDPFALAQTFREDWGPETSSVLSGTITPVRPKSFRGSEDLRVGPLIEAIRQGQRVLIESIEPIDRLASEVWKALPRRLRHRRSLATWAYTDTGVFDLVGLPRLTGIDPSDQRLFVVSASSLESIVSEGSPPKATK